MNIEAVDLFCGVGGLTYGIQQSGIDVIAGYDVDESCRFAYESNNHSKFIHKDIKEVTGKELNSLYSDNVDIKILMGCAPCQPFSSYSYRYKDNKNTINKMDLLDYFGNLVEHVQPDIVSMENVPQLEKVDVFFEFINLLKKNEYFVEWKVIFAPEYGVPQNRKRLLLLASKLGEVKLIDPLYKEKFITVKETIGFLPNIISGEVSEKDPMHRSVKLNDKNLRRIEQSIPGGTWRDWDEDLILACHRKNSGKSYSSVYGRMEWDKPAPTITTKFYGYGNGRFGHPEQNRAISYREGALLQTFPIDYKFLNSKKPVSFKKLGIQIGNAVPVKLGEVIGKSINKHIENVKKNPCFGTSTIKNKERHNDERCKVS
ncbi:DNA cytosine methyltransferase [Marinilactibacillus psychrotolerans]|uniref:Cytosine-specific methyltransferase n=1 Tax=Marinilactibacillus psychrotolerans TaxID=191770 RepID=A0ABW8UJD0_9LACT